MATLDALYPEESRGDEIGTQIPLGENVSSAEEIIKKEEGDEKKGQTN